MTDDDAVYLDHNASTPLVPEALEALTRATREGFANPSSAHVYGKRARGFVEEARAQVAGLVGAAPAEVVFTSGCTEANNLAVRGASGGLPVLTSTMEHPATAAVVRWLEESGRRVLRVDGGAAGRVRLDDVERALAALAAGDAGVFVTLIHAHNETGAIQPVAGVARLARAAFAAPAADEPPRRLEGAPRVEGAPVVVVHADGAQSVGKIPVDVRALDVDLLSIAGHKLGAPKGVGALVVRSGVTLEPLVRGAGHEGGRRPGTENVGSIAALGAACAVAARTLDVEMRRQSALRDRLFAALAAAVPGLVREGAPHDGPSLPNTLLLRFPGVSGAALLAACPGVPASTGSACHEDGGDDGARPVRLTLGRTTSDADVDRAAAALLQAWERRGDGAG